MRFACCALGLIGLLTSRAFAATPPLAPEAGFDVSAAAILKSAPPVSAFPNAGAVTLRDETVVRLQADGSYSDVSHETIKIFNQRGRRFADVTIPLNTSTERLGGIHARTILPGGKVISVKPEDIHVSSPYAEDAMYDDAKSVGFAMPGIEDGAIVDYTYTTTTRKPILAGQYAEHWFFQDGQNPVIYSRYTVTAPAGVTLQTQIHNAPGLTPTVKTSADGTLKTTVWEMRNRPDITSEPMMPPPTLFLPWMEVSTVPSWQTVAQWYQKLADPRTADSPEIKALVKQLTSGKTTDTDKARAIFYWVEGKTRYVAVELGLSAYQPHAAAEVCQNRYGDCKDMATLLVTMLHEAGIKSAWPVLLDADNKLPIRDHLASPGSFDHAIARADIDGKPYWFDSTAELCAFGEIPGGDRGCDAFVIRDGVGTFETIPVGGPENNVARMTNHVTLHADGSADCDSATKTDGDAALSFRFRFRAIKPDQLQEGFRAMVRDISPNSTLKTFTLSPFDDRDTPLSFDCAFHAPLWATKAGKLLIVPGSDSGATAFDRPTRTFPLYQDDSGELISDTIITLPSGFTLEDKPDDVHMKTPFGVYDMTYALAGDTLTIHTSQTTTPAFVPASDYAALKTQYETLAPQLKQPVVLRQAAK